jgi:hypothetical protein
LQLIAQRDGRDDLVPAGAARLPDGEGRRDVIARVGWFAAEVCVIEIQVADERPVAKGG